MPVRRGSHVAGWRRPPDALYFTDYFGVDRDALAEYGAFNISVVSDLPLFVDPFLLFNSAKSEYEALHLQIIEYLRFLKERSTEDLDPGLIAAWYRFKEVKQNWLGFTLFGNEGHALGRKFADTLHRSLGRLLTNFGDEQTTRGTHLEKLALISPRVGRDSISDFTVNLIKHYLLRYTEAFAREHLREEDVREFAVERSVFNFNTETWETRPYVLPQLRGDFVLLTPKDLLTRDNTWINHSDLLSSVDTLPAAIEDQALRAQVNNYLRSLLSKEQTARERSRAIQRVIERFPELIDVYIRQKEDAGAQAKAVSAERTDLAQAVLVDQVRSAIPDLERKTRFYQQPWTNVAEAQTRIRMFKDYVEKQDGHRLIRQAGEPVSNQRDADLFFGLIWCKSDFDINQRRNNGQGHAAVKARYGSGEASLIEFKLASNTHLKRHLADQIATADSAPRQPVEAIVCYTRHDQARAEQILSDLKLTRNQSVVVIDATGG